MHRSLKGVSAGLGLAALAFLLAGRPAQAQQANYSLPNEPTAQGV